MNFFSQTNLGNELLDQLQDIEGLDLITPWPLAPGWWIAGFLLFIIMTALIFLGIYWWKYKRSWRSDTFDKLSRLEKNLSEENVRETIIVLSEYIRRIVVRRFSRKECAGLVGKAWLKWLATHDPIQFDWEKKGTLLIQIPYSPIQENRDQTDSSENMLVVKDIIQAIRAWVR